MGELIVGVALLLLALLALMFVGNRIVRASESRSGRIAAAKDRALWEVAQESRPGGIAVFLRKVIRTDGDLTEFERIDVAVIPNCVDWQERMTSAVAEAENRLAALK